MKKKQAAQSQNLKRVETLTQCSFSQPVKKTRLKNISESCCLSEQVIDIEKLALFNKSLVSFSQIQAGQFENIFVERFSHRSFFCTKVDIPHLPQYKMLRT